MRQTELQLSSKDRQAVEAIRSRGSHPARQVNRAHVLAALDRTVPEDQIMQVLGVGRTMIWRTRAAYRQGGLMHALADMDRPGKPRRFGTDAEARITALVCSAPPEGAKRWTLVLLEKQVRLEPGIPPISRETIRRMLKKTASNPGAG